jgi:GAF domain-containing protein
MRACAIFQRAQPGQTLLPDDIHTALAPDLTISAFACVELLASTGSLIGALCVAGSAPRAWSASDQARLTDLAALVVQTIEIHIWDT